MQSERVAKGAVYLIFQSVLGYLFSLMFYVLVARVLGPSEVGKLSVLLTVSAVFSLTGLSVNYALQRLIPSYVESRRRGEVGGIIGAGLTILLGVSATGLVVLVVLSEWLSVVLFGSAVDGGLIVAILLASFLLTLTTFLGGGMLGFGMFRETAAQNILNAGVSRVLGLVLAVVGFGLMGVMLGWLVAGVVTVVFSVFLLGRNLGLKKGFPVKSILEFSLPVHFFTVIMFVQSWADIALLYALAPNLEQIGVYYLVVSGAAILSFFYAPIGMAIFPALSSRYSVNGFRAVVPMASAYVRLTCRMLIPLGASLAALSPVAVEVVYGPHYVSGATPFALLAATSIIPALSLLVVTVIQSTGYTRPLVVIGLASAVADMLLVAVFAGSLGGVAGAMGRIAFPAVGLILGYYFIWGKVRLRILPELKQPLIAAVSIALPLYLVDQYLMQILILPLRFRAPLDIMVFLALAVVFAYSTRYFGKEDFALVRQAVPNRLEPVVDRLERIFAR
ncbi:MAG: oligosaccharide flippase family protein [Thaumarchaeota archaeon]|nr:oligosaccharide flippase family protein [Nitrososphaerota archaeon]